MAVQENKMGVMPVKKLIINMSLPMMASMLVQALYNIVDSAFVSFYDSRYALAAVTLAFPMQNLMFALIGGTAVGVNALLSKSLGEKEFERADSTANMALLITFLTYLVACTAGFLFAGNFIASQTDTPEVREYGAVYLRICMTMSFGMYFQVMLERLLQSTGRTFYSMISQMTGAVVNIIFDPIMIFGLLGFPRLGVAGAAYATVLGQCVAAAIGLVLNLKRNEEIHFSFRSVITPNFWIIKRIYYVGIPSILMMAIGSVMTYSINLILGSFRAAADAAQAVFGAYFKLQSFFFMPVFGLNGGLVPILAYNYGARNKSRIDESLNFSIRLAVGIMAVGSLIFECFPAQLLGFFNASDDLLAMGVPALRIIGVHFPLAGVSITLGSVFQAFSKSGYSLIVSIARQLVVLIPAAWLMSTLIGVNGVWWAFPIAELMSLAVTVFFFRKLYREKVMKMQH